MAKLTLNDITGGSASPALINSNNALIEAAVENTLSRDGTTPNQMAADIDMNSNSLNNVQDLRTQRLFIKGNEYSGVLQLPDLEQIADVTLTDVASGEILKYDGSGWVNNTLAEAGISAVGHTHVEADITDLDKYTQAQVDTLLTGKANTSHTHVKADITDVTVVDVFGTPSANQIAYWADADTLVGSAAFTVSGTSLTVTGNITCNGAYINSSAVPGILFVETDAGTDQGIWYNFINGGIYSQSATDDGVGNAYSYMVMTRSGTGSGVQIDTITYSAEDAVVFNAAETRFGRDLQGDTILNFWDDTNNVYRQIFWDDSASSFYHENSGGTFDKIGSLDPGDNVTELDGTAYRTLYIDSAGDVQELAHGTSGQVLSSQGASANPQWVTLATATILDNYIDGMVMSNDAGDTAHDINITAGVCANDTNDAYIVLPSEITKQIDANWSAGDDAGGFPSGLTLAINTWYHVFVIWEEGGDTVDAGFDTSLTATNLLADATGYDHYRRIGSVLTDASSNILAFYSTGDSFWWSTAIEEVNDGSPGGGTETAATLSVPSGVITTAHCHVLGDYTGASATIGVWSTLLTDQTLAVTAGDHTLRITSGATFNHTFPDFVVDGGSIEYEADTNNCRVRIATLGWEDQRGKNG